MANKRIGFLSYWGTDRGLSAVTLNYVKMLQGEYDCYILKQGNNDESSNFKTVKVNVTEYPYYLVDEDFFVKWVLDNNLDAVIFNEYKQWTNENYNLVETTKNLGKKAYGYLVAERFKPEQTHFYDSILCPTVSHMRFMRWNKIRNFVHVPYSIDLTEFNLKKSENSSFVFYHPAGMGGVYNRKNTAAVLEAFHRLAHPSEQPSRDDIKLIISSQKNLKQSVIPEGVELIEKNLSREELIKLYYSVDASILPSKWETIGIPILESMAAGLPVITTDAPPMNEFVRTGMNGFVTAFDFKDYDGIEIKAAEVNTMSLKTNMENMLNRDLYSILARNSRAIVEKLYDIKKNKSLLLDFLKGELNE
jgi:glycosyltransferase involved in cell wall biosynthesis